MHFRGTHLGNTWYVVYLKDIGTLLPKNSSKQKTCQILRKQVICDDLLLNCITAKKLEILNSTTALSQLISISLFLEGEGGWELAEQ